MAFTRKPARRLLALLALTIIITGWLSPLSTLADTNLDIGGSAVIAYANGDDVALRANPRRGGELLQYVHEGSVVTILDNASEDGEGNLWFPVEVSDGTQGYIISDYLARNDGNNQAAEPIDPSSQSIGQALIAGTNNDGVRCRVDADRNSAIIAVIPEGTIVDLTGPAVGNWQPIACAGQLGYVHTDFVSYDLSGDTSGSNSDASANTAATESSAVTGGATVTGSGNGLRCRAGASLNATILTVLSDGSWLQLRGDAVGIWQPVICAGQNGYVSSEFLAYDGEESVDDAGTDAATGTAYVSGTNGDGVRCRTNANYNASVIVVLKEGTEVTLRGDQSGDWQPVFCAGQNGFVAAMYLSSNSGGSDGGDASSGGTGTGVISGTNGDGVRCRAGASYDAAVIKVIREGATVTLNGAQEGDWQPIICAGKAGYVFAQYVSTDGSGNADTGSGDGGSTAPSNSSLVAGDDAVVSGTNGDGVRLRAAANRTASIITVIAEGTTVSVIDGSTGNWVAVTYRGSNGFIHMDFLVAAGAEVDPADPGTGSGLAVGDHAATTSSVNLRYDPSYTGGVAAVAPKGTVVEVTGKPSNGFYPVDWDGLQGYMHGDFLKYTNADLSQRGGSGEEGNTDNGGNSGATGSPIVDFALMYVGYPYVWGTHGPSSFDCSGFTHWVIWNVLGMDISYSNVTQYAYGYEVGRNELQPGDLVFFQNTYTWGNSHVGIYIGNNQFIHAENESTGVVISSLDSSYYASRWYGARRLT